jgi:hypothetical protein
VINVLHNSMSLKIWTTYGGVVIVKLSLGSCQNIWPINHWKRPLTHDHKKITFVFLPLLINLSHTWSVIILWQHVVFLAFGDLNICYMALEFSTRNFWKIWKKYGLDFSHKKVTPIFFLALEKKHCSPTSPFIIVVYQTV